MFMVILLLSASFSALLGYWALEVMPCRWFGSPLEGACGYSAVFFTGVVGVVLTFILTTIGMAKFLSVMTSSKGREQ
jgi:hypothetical protein